MIIVRKSGLKYNSEGKLMSIREKYDALYWVLRNMQESMKVNFRIMLKNRDWKDYLKQNKKLKNIHKRRKMLCNWEWTIN